MAKAVKRKPRRGYDSSRRQAQARETQGQIATAAGELFVERGYTATSIRDIADAAGVSVQTIYNAFDGGKPAILARVIDIAVVGDDEPVALAERADVRAVLAATDPRAIVSGWAGYVTAINVRLMPLFPAIREAANVQPEIAALWNANYVDGRYQGTLAVAAHLKQRRGLPRGMTAERAADLMFTYATVDTAISLIRTRGWSPDAYAAWSAEMFCRLFEIA